MPDFPPTGGATAAEIWSYATRTLTNLSDTRAAYIDRLANIEAYEAPVEGTATFNTGDTYPKTVTIIDTTGTNKLHLIDGYVDLTALGTNESITVKEYMQIASGGSPVKYAEYTYTGPVNPPLIHITTKPARYALKIELTMSSAPGANRSFAYQLFKKVIA